MVIASKPSAPVRPRSIRRRQQLEAKSVSPKISKKNISVLVYGLFLFAGTLALYSPVGGHDFVNYDDKDYVLANSHVTSGLSWQTVRWSLTSTEQANWHPVTWLSHALDYQLFGLNAVGHHWMSLSIHLLNVVLLFLLLYKATGIVRRSFVVAALFAWHPFNVQSVAWVAERKNLLSTFFVLLTLGTYAWYALKPGWKRMVAVICVFVLALASKPMAVTLPFVLLLLDYWPLQRVTGWTQINSRFAVPQRSVQRLFLEKLPLFVLSAASCAMTVFAQGQAVKPLEQYSFATRFSNVLHSYGIYAWKTLWPSGFAVYYPLARLPFTSWKVVLPTLLLSAITIVVWTQRRERPYLLVGWLWYVGTLVPVIGIVQVGDQAFADRYAYVPLIGLFILIVWAASDLLDLSHTGQAYRWGLAVVAIGISCFLTSKQLQYWQNSVTLWTRALQITGGELQIEKQLANALVDADATDQAMPYLLHIAAIDPNDTSVRANLGTVYAAHGQLPEAKHEFEAVVKLTDHKDLSADDRKFRSSIFLNLGFAYTRSKDYLQALENYKEAYQFDPELVNEIIRNFNDSLSNNTSESGYLTVGLLLVAKGQGSDAASLMQVAINANPDYTDARDFLNNLKGNEKSTANGADDAR